MSYINKGIQRPFYSKYILITYRYIHIFLWFVCIRNASFLLKVTVLPVYCIYLNAFLTFTVIAPVWNTLQPQHYYTALLGPTNSQQHSFSFIQFSVILEKRHLSLSIYLHLGLGNRHVIHFVISNVRGR